MYANFFYRRRDDRPHLRTLQISHLPQFQKYRNKEARKDGTLPHLRSGFFAVPPHPAPHSVSRTS